MKKRFFEDVQIGEAETSMGRTITETDIVNFAALSGDYNSIHTDAEFAKNTAAGQRLAHGLLVTSIAFGLYSRTEFSSMLSPNLVALKGLKNWSFRKPVFIGDTIRIRIEVIDKEDYGKPDRARITLHRDVLNQRDEVVASGETDLVVKKRPAEA